MVVKIKLRESKKSFTAKAQPQARTKMIIQPTQKMWIIIILLMLISLNISYSEWLILAVRLILTQRI